MTVTTESDPSAESAADRQRLASDTGTLNELILQAFDGFAAETCFRIERAGRWRDVSYRVLRRQTLRLTRFFLDRGLHGRRIAIWAGNSPEWMQTHLAAILAGAAVVPIRHSMPADTVRKIVADCAARVVAVGGSERVAALVESLTLAGEGFGELELILDLEDSGADDDTERVLDLASLVSERLDETAEAEVEEQARSVPSDSLACIYYASSRGDVPLGAVFDQGQRHASMRHIGAWLEVDEDDLAFTAMPWSYMPSLDSSLYWLIHGVPNALAQSRELIFEEIQQVSPTVALTIPNALERAYDEVIQKRIRKLPESSQAMFDWALATGRQLQAAGDHASRELRERYARADMTFFSSIRGDFGGRFRRFYCTGASLPRQLAESLRAIGMEPVNVYSESEAGGFPAVNLPTAGQNPTPIDACGPAAEGFELRIAGDGELLVRGETVMRGYWQQPEFDRSSFDENGWLRTGDYGRLDEHGVLFVTGRKGDTLILSTGRKVWPAEIEAKLMTSPFVHQAAVFGESRPYVSAFIVPDLEAIAAHLTEQLGEESGVGAQAVSADDVEAGEDDGLDHVVNQMVEPVEAGTGPASTLRWIWSSPDETGISLTTHAHARVKALFDALVSKVNASVDEWERIGSYSLLGQETAGEARQLADDRAHDRTQLAQRWSDAIQAMYPRGSVRPEREITQVEVGPERLRELLEKESILDAWTGDAGIGFLFDLARAQRIDAPSVVHICDTAASVAQMEAEEKPLSTALIVGDPMRIHRVLSPSLIQLRRHDHIRRMRNRLVDLAKLVDGLVLAYVVDRHGYVRGICRLDLELPAAPAAVLGPQFRLHSDVSKRCNAVVFFVPKGGRQVRVFAQGALVGRYSNGDWAPEVTGQLDAILESLTAERGYDATLLRRLLRCAFRMSEENLGAIFLLGDADAILAKSDAPEISHFALLVSAAVASLSDDELINFAQQDGATVIDSRSGRFRACMVLLRPDAGTEAQVGPGKGARHSSAAKISTETGALAITVSQDGPITLYDEGRRILSL
ncbi:MAG: AMP-binding protein [Thermoanaerobaculia bacterium]|nr:AMP-binding protein [Thermoanaerobaculia bacterium]